MMTERFVTREPRTFERTFSGDTYERAAIAMHIERTAPQVCALCSLDGSRDGELLVPDIDLRANVCRDVISCEERRYDAAHDDVVSA